MSFLVLVVRLLFALARSYSLDVGLPYSPLELVKDAYLALTLDKNGSRRFGPFLQPYVPDLMDWREKWTV